MRKYSCNHVTARSEYCCMRSVGMRDDAMPDDVSSVRASDSRAVVPAQACPTKLSSIAIAATTMPVPAPTQPLLDSKSSSPRPSPMHAVFISGLPKLPSRNLVSLHFSPLQRYNVLDIKALAL